MGRDTPVVHVLDDHDAVLTVELAKLVDVFDQVVGDPADLLAVADTEKHGPGIVRIVLVVAKDEAIALGESGDCLSGARKMTDPTDEEQQRALAGGSPLGAGEHLDPISGAATPTASENLEGVRVPSQVDP